jgi:hypothetical protein
MPHSQEAQLADQVVQGPDGRTYRNGVVQVSSSPDPSAGGAIHAAIAAIANAMAPRSIVDRQKRINQQVDEDSGAPQNSDLGSQL